MWLTTGTSQGGHLPGGVFVDFSRGVRSVGRRGPSRRPHSLACAPPRFDVNRADKHIIQSIAILDTLDKDINTFAMRVREWYSWHFPELVKIISDNYMYYPTLALALAMYHPNPSPSPSPSPALALALRP